VKRIRLPAVLVVLLLGAAILMVVPRGRAQVQLTIEPAMVKGNPGSPVTIVEFSDYQ
jgi:protein-disulfide isomerase